MYLYTGSLEQVDTVCQPVLSGIKNLLDAGLYDKLGAFDTRSVCDVQSGSFAVVSRPCDLGDGVGFGM